MRYHPLRKRQKLLKSPGFRIQLSVERKFIIWAIIGLFMLAQVYFTIQTATTGAVLANLERQETELNKMNSDLSEKVISSTSLTAIEEKAQNLGFAQPKQVIYLNTDEFAVKLP